MDFFTLKHISLLFFVISILSYQTHGRENFSKFTHVVDTEKHIEKTDNSKNETKLPNEVVDPLNKQNQEQEQDPTFIPQTQNGYGLYGRNAPDEKTTTPDNHDERNGYYYNNNENKYNNNYNNNNGEFENVEEEDLSTDTSLLGKGYTTPISSYNSQNGNYYNGDTSYNSHEQRNQKQYNNGDNTYSSEDELENYSNLYNSNSQYNNGNRYNSNQQDNTENKYRYNKEQRYYNGGNTYNDNEQRYTNGGNEYNNEQQKQQYTNNGGNKYNAEKQGMSDTRYLENGRYYYDINNEKNYYRNYNTDRSFENNENAYEFDKSGDEYKNKYP